MNTPTNPFSRGYYDFKIRRFAVINYDDRHPESYVPLHSSQSHLSDEAIVHRTCIFNDDFVLVTEGHTITPELDAVCGGQGTISTVRHSIYGRINEAFDHIGDCYTLEGAQQVVRRLSFDTGHYSRCWEISTAHITEASGRYLCDLADIATPTGFLFIAFRVPYSPAIGVKLIATPWTDEHLKQVNGITADQLVQEHQSKGRPEDLIQVLQRAAMADVRILIFDADAFVLDGLPIYET